jgi:hypothetical protein
VLGLAASLNYSHLEHVEQCPDLGPSCAQPDPPAPEKHLLDLWWSELRLDAELGIVRWLSVQASLSLRTLTEQVAYTDLRGAAIIAPDAGLHHRNETLVGPGDPWLLAHAGGARGALTGSLRAGISIPLGRTVPDPFRLGELGIAHEHFQFGTGTVDPIVAADGRWFLRGWSLGAWALAKLPLYANGYGYQAGKRVVGGLFAQSNLKTERWTFVAGLDASWEGAETWSGQVEGEGNLGRTDLLFDGTVLWRFAMHWTAALTTRVYLYSFVVGEQLSTPLLVEVGLIRAFELWGD